MKNVLFNIKSVITGSSKAVAGAGAETFWKSEPEPERKKIVSAPQHWVQHHYSERPDSKFDTLKILKASVYEKILK